MTKIAISAGPCQFCDWTIESGPLPVFAYNPDDPRDGLLACPKCGMELLNQTMLPEEEKVNV